MAPNAAATLAFVAALPGFALDALAQGQDRLPQVSLQDQAIVLGAFAAGAAGVFLYLARDVILRKKTDYDRDDLESKHEKTFEKYHSDWGDDYEEVGSRTAAGSAGPLGDGELPDYYGALGVESGATQDEIKARFRDLAKKHHPDRAGGGSDDEMAAINEAYGVLSDEDLRAEYDRRTQAGSA